MNLRFIVKSIIVVIKARAAIMGIHAAVLICTVGVEGLSATIVESLAILNPKVAVVMPGLSITTTGGTGRVVSVIIAKDLITVLSGNSCSMMPASNLLAALGAITGASAAKLKRNFNVRR